MIPPHGRDAAIRFGLTLRELDVIALLVRGHDTGEIADRLHLQPQTIRNITHRIGRKMGVSGRLRIVALAHELDLAPLPEE